MPLQERFTVDHEKILKLKSYGVSPRDIAYRLGCSLTSVKRVIKINESKDTKTQEAPTHSI